MHRAGYIAAAALFSGGATEEVLDLAKLGMGLTGKVKVVDIPYVTPSRKVPVLVAWGGESDKFGMAGVLTIEFARASKNLTGGLKKDGHLFVSCDHGGGHTVPSGGLTWGLDFIFKHTLDGRASPFEKGALPSIYPQYCKLTTP